jgi:aerobic C4-dicarboxylate transport protein
VLAGDLPFDESTMLDDDREPDLVGDPDSVTAGH